MHGLLAPSPAAFVDSHNIVPIPGVRSASPFTLTHLGLRIRLQLTRHIRSGLHTGLLNCMDRMTGDRVGVHLISLRNNCFLRTRLDQLVRVQQRRPVSDFMPLQTRTIYIQQRRLLPFPTLRASQIRTRYGPTTDNFYLLRTKGRIARPVVKAICGMCVRCPARRLSFLSHQAVM
jgi:hypothetical protein